MPLAVIILCIILTACIEKGLFPDSAEEPEEVNTTRLTWQLLHEGERLDDYIRVDNKVFCGDSSSTVHPMQGVLTETFEVLTESRYARDSLRVYYPVETLQVQVADTIWITYCNKYVVEGVIDPFSFRYIGRGYATDNLNLFYKGRMVDDI